MIAKCDAELFMIQQIVMSRFSARQHCSPHFSCSSSSIMANRQTV